MNPTSLGNLSSRFQNLQMVMVAIDNATTAKLVVNDVTGRISLFVFYMVKKWEVLILSR